MDIVLCFQENRINVRYEIENRKCKFRDCLAYYDGNSVKFFEAETEGKLSNEIRGLDNKENWSKLSYIFAELR